MTWNKQNRQGVVFTRFGLRGETKSIIPTQGKLILDDLIPTKRIIFRAPIAI